MARPASVVASDDLRPVLLAGLRVMRVDEDGQVEEGPLRRLARRASEIDASIAPESFVRKVNAVLSGQQPVIAATTADVLALALGWTLAGLCVPEFSWTLTGAREAAEVHFELAEEDATKLERERLARSLYHFARGYVLGDEALTEEKAAERPQRVPAATRSQRVLVFA